jgi:serine/threonine protein kinase
MFTNSVEYGEGSAVSTIGDVCSLGIFLLEMFTGRSPTDDMFGDTVDLHKYVEHVLLSEGILDIADSTIWFYIGSMDSIIRSRVKDCLVSAFGLAIYYSSKGLNDGERRSSGDAHNHRFIPHIFLLA